MNKSETKTNRSICITSERTQLTDKNVKALLVSKGKTLSHLIVPPRRMYYVQALQCVH